MAQTVDFKATKYWHVCLLMFLKALRGASERTDNVGRPCCKQSKILLLPPRKTKERPTEVSASDQGFSLLFLEVGEREL
jgi:hypothetical protein